jgi:hypothetical protein
MMAAIVPRMNPERNMKRGITIAALLAASTIASAQAGETLARQDKLKGMTQVSDGLYASRSEKRASYVATNAAGRVALAEQMRKVNALFASQYAVDGISRAEREMLDRSERTQEELRQSNTHSKADGSCSSGAYVVANVSAYDGHSASAYAVNALDFGPVTPTDNYAWVRAGYSLFDTGIGQDAAEISIYNSSACISEAYAHVLCPAGYSGGTADYTVSVDPYSNCQIP